MDEKQLQALYDLMSSRLSLDKWENFRDNIGKDQNFRKAFYDQASKEAELGDFKSFDTYFNQSQGLSAPPTQPVAKSAKQSIATIGSAYLDGQLKLQPQKEIAPTSDDPLGEAFKPLKELLNQRNEHLDRVRTVESVGQKEKILPDKDRDQVPIDLSVRDLTNKMEALKESYFTNTHHAETTLMDLIQQKGDPSKLVLKDPSKYVFPNGPSRNDPYEYTEESIRAALPAGNETGYVAFEKHHDMRAVKTALNESKDFSEAALRYGLATGDVTSKQLGFLGKKSPDVLSTLTGDDQPHFDPTSEDIPPSMRGELTMNFMNSPQLQELAYQDQKMLTDLRREMATFPQKNPEAALKILTQYIGQKREDAGKNNVFFNSGPISAIDKQLYGDKIIENAVKSGELPASYQKFYDNPRIKRLIADNLPAPGFLENAVEGLGEGVKDIAGAFYSPFRRLIKSEKDILYDKLEKQYSTPAFKPKGLAHNLSFYGGHMTGYLVPTMVGGNVLKAANIVKSDAAANAIMFGLQSWAPNAERAIELMPGESKTKQLGYTALTTGINMALANAFNYTGALRGMSKEIEPKVADIISRFSNKEITAAAAKEQFVDAGKQLLMQTAPRFIKETGKGMLEGGAMMGTISSLQSIADDVFSGRPVDYNHAIQAGFDSFHTGFLGSAFIAAAGAKTKMAERPVMGKLLLKLSEHPEYYSRIVQDFASVDGELGADKTTRLENLQHLVDVKTELDKTTMSDRRKGQYLLHSLNEKILNERLSVTKDQTLKNEIKEQLNISKDIKEQLIAGKRPVSADLLPQDLEGINRKWRIAVERAKTPEEKTALNEQHAKDVAEFIKQNSFDQKYSDETKAQEPVPDIPQTTEEAKPIINEETKTPEVPVKAEEAQPKPETISEGSAPTEEQPVPQEVTSPTVEEVKVKEKSEKAVEEKIDELTDKKTSVAKLRAQKADFTGQLSEIENALWGDVENKEELRKLGVSGFDVFDQDGLDRVKKLGYKVDDNGMITVHVKNDGEFKFDYRSMIDVADMVKKDFPDTKAPAPTIKIQRSHARQKVFDIAYNRGSVEKNKEYLDAALHNEAEAKKSGNKKMLELWSNEVKKEQEIFKEAKTVDWQTRDLEVEMNQDKEVQEWKREYHNDGHKKYYGELGFYEFSTSDYTIAKENGILGKGYSFEEAHLLIEAATQGKALKAFKRQLIDERDTAEEKMKEKFGRKDGAGFKARSTKSQKSEFESYQNRINVTNAKIKLIESLARKKSIDMASTGPARSEETDEKQEVYDEVAGMAPINIPGRIPVDPIVGGKAKNIAGIIYNVTSSLKQRLFFLKPGRSRAIGTYTPSHAGVKIKFSGDLDTTAHEIGHSIDDQYKLLREIEKNPEALKELKKFSQFGSNPPSGVSGALRKQYIYGEGIAEFIRALVVNPTATKEAAPNVHEIFYKHLPEKVTKAIEKFSDDVRTWAGSSGKDVVLSNVEFEPKKEAGMLGQLFKKADKTNSFFVTWADRAASNMLNPLRVFEKAFRYAKGVRGMDEVLPEHDPQILSRMLLGIDGKFGEILKSGMVDGRGEVLKTADGKIKNLDWLLAPLDNRDVHSVERDMKDVIAYMVAERTFELQRKFGRSNVLTGIGGGVYKDLAVARQALKEFRDGDPIRLQRIEEATKRYREFADDILLYMVEKGRLSMEQYKNIKADNIQYVALQRVLESEPGEELEIYTGSSGKIGSVSEPVKKIKGSTRTISNPYVSLLDSLYKSIKEADRNEVLKSFRDMIYEPRGMYDGTPKRFSDVGVIAKQGDKNTIRIFIDGKPEYWAFQPDIYKSLKGLDADAYKLPLILTAHAKILRFTTTNFPTFAIRNWIRDTQDRLIKSNENTGLSGITNLFGDKEDWKAVARAGGLNAGYYMKNREYYYGLLREGMEDMAKNKKFIIMDVEHFKKGWEKYHDLLYKSETSNRVAEYRSGFNNAKYRGMDNYNASLYGAYKARNLIDFGVAGHWMKIINQIIPFSNAAVQGLRSTVINAKESPTGFVVRTLLYSVLPAAALWVWNHRNKEDGDQYENLPAYQRDMFWMSKIGDNKWLAIPKPYELSLAAAGADRLLSKLVWKNDKAFHGFQLSTLRSLMPIDDAAFASGFQPIIEGITNHDFYRDKTIIPPDEDALNLALRHTETASRLGKILQSISGIDARKIDHYVKSQFSYMGNFAVKSSDIGSDNNRTGFDITDTGLFKASPGYNAPAVQEFVTFAKEWDLTRSKDYRDFNNLARNYFDSKTDADKERYSKEMIDYAKFQLAEWKRKEIDKKQVNKFDKKYHKSKTEKDTGISGGRVVQPIPQQGQ